MPFHQVAKLYGVKWEGDPAHNKGHAGRLVHLLTGDDSKNAPAADLSNLGIEVKSIPVDSRDRVLEPTKVGSIDFERLWRESWWESEAFQKLRAVLFVPVVKSDQSRPDLWYIRRPFLWLPSEAVLAHLKDDYDSLRGLVREGKSDEISSAYPPEGQGDYLHPKPSHGKKDKYKVYSLGGKDIELERRAWMLREKFTQPIVSANLKLDSSVFPFRDTPASLDKGH
jgi:DNA mismatch repair protein MutH